MPAEKCVTSQKALRHTMSAARRNQTVYKNLQVTLLVTCKKIDCTECASSQALDSIHHWLRNPQMRSRNTAIKTNWRFWCLNSSVQPEHAFALPSHSDVLRNNHYCEMQYQWVESKAWKNSAWVLRNGMPNIFHSRGNHFLPRISDSFIPRIRAIIGTVKSSVWWLVKCFTIEETDVTCLWLLFSTVEASQIHKKMIWKSENIARMKFCYVFLLVDDREPPRQLVAHITFIISLF